MSDTTHDDLVKRLTITAGVMEMGEMIAWGSDTALMREAADRIEELEAENERLLDEAVEAVMSAAENMVYTATKRAAARPEGETS